jgi:hypothetical protein
MQTVIPGERMAPEPAGERPRPEASPLPAPVAPAALRQPPDKRWLEENIVTVPYGESRRVAWPSQTCETVLSGQTPVPKKS